MSKVRQVKIEPAAPADSSDLEVRLWFDPNNAPADGKAQDGAWVKVTQNGFNKYGYGVQLKINDGSAIFQDADEGSNGKIKTVTTGSMGRASASFMDAVAEQKSMTATIVKDSNGGAIVNGPSDTETFTFAQAVTDAYALILSKITDGSPADGKTPDVGQAIVTDNGGILATPVIVKFEFTKGSAQFVLAGDPNIQPGSTATLLLVKTHYDSDLGKDIANASFTDNDAHGDSVTLKASLPDYQDVAPETQNFSFKAVVVDAYELVLKKIKDDAPADGKSADQGQAVVTYDGNPVPDGTLVTFQLSASSATFQLSDPNIVGHGENADGSTWIKVKTQTRSNQSLANASFVDSNAKGEIVTLSAWLSNDTDVRGQPLQFTFTPVGYQLMLIKVADNAATDGQSFDKAIAVVTYGGEPLTESVKVKFDANAYVGYIISGDEQFFGSGSSSNEVWVKFGTISKFDRTIAHWEPVYSGEPLSFTITASLPDHPEVLPQTQNFYFGPFDDSDYGIVLNSIVNNSPADGETANQVQVVVTRNGNAVGDGTLVQVMLSNGSQSAGSYSPLLDDLNIIGSDSGQNPDDNYNYFVWVEAGTQTLNGQSVVNLRFTDKVAETVTVNARLWYGQDIKAEPLNFTFS